MAAALGGGPDLGRMARDLHGYLVEFKRTAPRCVILRVMQRGDISRPWNHILEPVKTRATPHAGSPL